MTILSSEKESEIKLVAVNAVGDLFKAVLNHESRLNQDIIDQTNYDDVTMDFDLDDSEINTTVHATSTIFDGESTVRSFNTSKSEDLMALEMYSSHPVDNYKLEWMKFRELNQKEHEVLDNWEQQLKTFRKVAFASELFQREALPQNIDKRKNSNMILFHNKIIISPLTTHIKIKNIDIQKEFEMHLDVPEKGSNENRDK